MENSTRFLRKLEVPYDPAGPLLGVQLKEVKTVHHRDTFTPMFGPTLLTTARIRKQPTCASTDE
jgi:hypothetical protein